MVARLLGEFPDIVLVTNAEGNLLWANQTAEQLFGQRLEESLGQSALEFVHPDDLEIVLRSFESVQGKELGNLLEVRVKIGGEWRLIELIGTPVSWYEEGALLFSLRDLTTRRRFEVARDSDARLRTLVHNAATVLLFVSPEGNVESVSGALTRMLGHDPEHLEGAPLADLVVPEDQAALASALAEALRGASAAHPVTQGVRLLHHGTLVTTPYELSIVNLLDDPTVHGLVVTAHDVSIRVAAQNELQEALRELRETFSLLHATLESTANGLLVVGTDRNITSYNSNFVDMWHIPEDLLSSSSDLTLLPYAMRQLEEPEEFLARVEELYAQPETESLDMIAFRDGRVFERYSKPQFVSGSIVGRVWSFNDITQQKRLENELAHLAFHDALTGLANRALFKDRLDQAAARSERTGKYFAVLYLDLDNFKNINDSLGHSAGDELLTKVAEVLTSCLRRSDTAARLGGDEFAVLVEDVDSHDEVIKLAKRIMGAIREPLTISRQQMSVTVSVGVTFGITGSTSEQLLRNADLAMYLAKSQGKNRVEEFQDQMHTAVVARLELEADLRTAVKSDQFVVHYQPIFNLNTGRVVGFEALVRWQHPTRGLLSPIDFVPFAEEIGLIDLIDRIVLASACAQIRTWQDQRLASQDLVISINLSARELVTASIGASVANTLSQTSFVPANLILEITESAVMRDVDAAVRNLHSLKSLGLRVAIDDFGTGYSSFSHLEHLPIDILKIDRSFVAKVSPGPNHLDLAQAICQLAQTLGLETIAEGVETAEQAEHLRTIGCTLAQGYFLGRPLSVVDTEVLLRSRLTSTGDDIVRPQ